VRIVGLDGLSRTVKEPYVVEEICNGCGICENVCPLETKAGIEVFAVKNRTPIRPQLADQVAKPSSEGYQ
jgi:ferredoxin